MSDDGLFLKPTAVGIVSTTAFRLQNETRVPLSFCLALPDNLRENFSVLPAGGRLKGKETQVIRVSSKGNCPNIEE